ncbi:MAG: HD domain-containing protein [Candidatus Paceibacteria bacterium]
MSTEENRKSHKKFVERQRAGDSNRLLRQVISSLKNNNLYKDMQSIKRWERYIENDRADLSRDMNEFGHALNTYQIAKEMANYSRDNEELTEEERNKILITALIHDLGELETGDVSFDEKSKEDVRAEKDHFREALDHYFPDPGFSKEDRRKLLDIFENIAHGDSEENLSEYFDMIEKLGYVTTALEEFERKPEKINWSWICDNVFHHQVEGLAEYIEKYPSAKKYLSQQKGKIKDVLSFLEKQNQENLEDTTESDIESWRRDIIGKL